MTLIRRALVVLFASVVCTAAWPFAHTADAQPPKQQEIYVPIDQLPPQEQVAALPLLVAAYVFVPVVLFMYLLSLARRMTAVSREIERLELDLKRPGRT